MEDHHILYTRLKETNISPTPNRILVLSTLYNSKNPLSISDIENLIHSLDKSSISRVLKLFKEKHIIHTIDNPTDGKRYEICRSKNKEFDEDSHVHFFCENCQHLFCLSNIQIPTITLPKNFTQTSTNFLIKGICPKCKNKN